LFTKEDDDVTYCFVQQILIIYLLINNILRYTLSN